jgi:uncharacterized protein (TIGR02453 family)
MRPARTEPRASQRASDQGVFRGWSVEAIEFFEEIEIENTKAYWTTHKDLYQAKVLGPMVALLAELAPEFGQGRVFRPYRDTRFSTDKSPYKTNIAAHNEAGYISLSSGALGVGTGLYMPSSDQLARLRTAIAQDRSGQELVRLVTALRKKHLQVTAHEILKSAPRGYSIDHPRIELLRYKGVTKSGRWAHGSIPQHRSDASSNSFEPPSPSEVGWIPTSGVSRDHEPVAKVSEGINEQRLGAASIEHRLVKSVWMGFSAPTGLRGARRPGNPAQRRHVDTLRSRAYGGVRRSGERPRSRSQASALGSRGQRRTFGDQGASPCWLFALPWRTAGA